MTPEETDFLKEHRWDLAKAHRERSDQAANLLRGLLFTAAVAAMGLILQQRLANGLRWHALSLLLLMAAAVLIFLSWDRQKGKAIGKFDGLTNNDFAKYESYSKWFPNYIIDRLAGIYIVCGVLVEIILSI
jgi:hypothetical protein